LKHLLDLLLRLGGEFLARPLVAGVGRKAFWARLVIHKKDFTIRIDAVIASIKTIRVMEVIILLAIFALCFALFTTGVSVVTVILSILFSNKKK
jgi:hypothetical protein